MSRYVLFLGGDTLPWLEIENGQVAGRGEDFRGSGVPVIAIAPASGLVCRQADFAGLSPAQALAAARLDAADASIGADQHVAVAASGDHYAIVDKGRMHEWLARLAEYEVEPAAIIPAPDLLPVPESGFVRGVLHDEAVLRSAGAALEDDGVIAPMVVGDAPVRTLEPAELERAIAAAIEAPPLDLLQGDFAPRTDWSAPAGYWRRLAMLAAVAVVLMLAVPVAQLARLSWSASSLEAESQALAARALGERSPSEDASDRLEDKLADLRGGGAGFLAEMGAVMAAMEPVANAELAALSFEADGTLRATVRAGTQPEIDLVGRGLEARGFAVTQSAARATQGRAEADLQARQR